MELARWEYRADMMVSAMTGRVKDMRVGREKDYLGDRVVLTSMPWGAVTGHLLSKLSRVWLPALAPSSSSLSAWDWWMSPRPPVTGDRKARSAEIGYLSK
jgi:hypothetical protein